MSEPVDLELEDGLVRLRVLVRDILGILVG